MIYTILVEATYDADADDTFQAALVPSEMQDAMKGLATYKGMPEGPIAQGDTFHVTVTFLGAVGMLHEMHVERLDPVSRTIQSRESNAMVQRWDHTLRINPTASGCVWRDTIVLDAGRMTPLSARMCRYVYARRHRKRRALGIRTLITKGELQP